LSSEVKNNNDDNAKDANVTAMNDFFWLTFAIIAYPRILMSSEQ
jgi:hypothetical protein